MIQFKILQLYLLSFFFCGFYEMIVKFGVRGSYAQD